MIFAFKEPAGTVSNTFKAFSRSYILLELEMISVLQSWICSSFKKIFFFFFFFFFFDVFIPIFKIWE